MKEHLDAWTQGYLSYLRDVGRKARGTVRDVRCTLKRVRGAMQTLQPGVPLWKLALADYLKWLEQERTVGTSPQMACFGLMRGRYRAGHVGQCAEYGCRRSSSAKPVRPLS
ncbi:MAG: hypothetical protein AB7K24_13830 [Gemmataceae bacterium]